MVVEEYLSWVKSTTLDWKNAVFSSRSDNFYRGCPSVDGVRARCVKEGSLRVYDRVLQKWRDGYFVLRPTCMFYFYHSREALQPFGFANLDEYSEVRRLQGEDNDHRVLIYRGDDHDGVKDGVLLEMESNDQVEDWMEAFHEHQYDKMCMERQHLLGTNRELLEEMDRRKEEAESQTERLEVELEALRQFRREVEAVQSFFESELDRYRDWFEGHEVWHVQSIYDVVQMYTIVRDRCERLEEKNREEAREKGTNHEAKDGDTTTVKDAGAAQPTIDGPNEDSEKCKQCEKLRRVIHEKDEFIERQRRHYETRGEAYRMTNRQLRVQRRMLAKELKKLREREEDSESIGQSTSRDFDGDEDDDIIEEKKNEGRTLWSIPSAFVRRPPHLIAQDDDLMESTRVEVIFPADTTKLGLRFERDGSSEDIRVAGAQDVSRKIEEGIVEMRPPWAKIDLGDILVSFNDCPAHGMELQRLKEELRRASRPLTLTLRKCR